MDFDRNYYRLGFKGVFFIMGKKYCVNCGVEIPENRDVCKKCIKEVMEIGSLKNGESKGKNNNIKS